MPDTLLPKEAPPATPSGLALRNYPNPFNPLTVIEYTVPEEARVVLSVDDASGRRVALLKDEIHAAGTYIAHFDCTGCPSGLYVIRMKAGTRALSRRLILLK